MSVIRGGKKTPPIIRSCDTDGGGLCAVDIYLVSLFFLLESWSHERDEASSRRRRAIRNFICTVLGNRMYVLCVGSIALDE